MEKFGSFGFVRASLAAFAVLAMAACANQGPNPRAANIVPPPPPPNPLQQQAPQQQQTGPPQQIAQMPQQGQQQQMQQQQQRGAARAPAPAPAGNLVMGGHLESHKSMEGAEAAWQSLVRKQPALQQLRPYFVPVLVRGEPWVRVLAGDFADRNEVNQFCNWARAQKMYCAPMPLAGASLENPSSIGGGGGAAPSSSAPRQQPQRQPRGAPQSGDGGGTLPVPAPVAAPTPVAAPVAAAPALVAPAPNATPPQPLAPPLPPRRQAGNPALPQ